MYSHSHLLILLHVDFLNLYLDLFDSIIVMLSHHQEINHELLLHQHYNLYLNKLKVFQDAEPVKVVTGIRRCGKSSLLKLMVNYLLESGVHEEQIIEMNFESYVYRKMNADDFYHYVSQLIIPHQKMYLFFDELQRITGWEDVVNSFRVDFNCDIYITG